MAIAIGMWESGQWDGDAGKWRSSKPFANANDLSKSDLTMCGAILARVGCTGEAKQCAPGRTLTGPEAEAARQR